MERDSERVEPSHRKILRDNIRRLVRRGGVKRISGLIYEDSASGDSRSPNTQQSLNRLKPNLQIQEGQHDERDWEGGCTNRDTQ